MSKMYKCQITESKRLNERYCHITLVGPEIAAQARPGQFINLQIGVDSSSNDPLLKRPFSIHRVNQNLGTVELLIKVVGRGTKQLADLVLNNLASNNLVSSNFPTKKMELEVIGPLGRGFSLQKSGTALLIAGGIGVAPLKELASSLAGQGVDVTILLGVSDVEDLVLVESVKEFSPEVIVVNPADTGFRQGLITELVQEQLNKNDYDQIYACGPKAMLVILQKLLGEKNSLAQFSLEENMGCGVGLCYSCVCKTKVNSDSDLWKYERICTCGPVFKGDEVILV